MDRRINIAAAVGGILLFVLGLSGEQHSLGQPRSIDAEWVQRHAGGFLLVCASLGRRLGSPRTVLRAQAWIVGLRLAAGLWIGVVNTVTRFLFSGEIATAAGASCVEGFWIGVWAQGWFDTLTLGPAYFVQSVAWWVTLIGMVPLVVFGHKWTSESEKIRLGPSRSMRFWVAWIFLMIAGVALGEVEAVAGHGWAPTELRCILPMVSACVLDELVVRNMFGGNDTPRLRHGRSIAHK
jgi:hypothetical protein